MKKLKSFLFVSSLMLSILLVVWCFNYADSVRGYNALGGEIFTIMLPLWIVTNKINALKQNKRNEVK